eukprot:CAMPEP_0117439284 /NCGR_PEP_ID=MMETSP0759-20121206/2487_1 /TAXON_ID=63605 /ORGANISM="Percolomonas cosmopolitus, Strain WS" /LENGTH=671 /DNA_ID=CAMNT_0005230997 /DNA_START=284 /DNA_END=2296 /DNA_ORIENTATION=+
MPSSQSLTTFKCDSRILCASISSRTQQYIATGHENALVNMFRLVHQDSDADSSSDAPPHQHDIRHILQLKGHKSPVTSLLISPLEDYIMTGSDGGSLKYFDLKQERVLRTFSPGHRAMITCVAFQPVFYSAGRESMGHIFASGSLDTNLKIWDLRVKQATHTLKGHYKGVKCCKFTPDSKWIVSGAESGTVKIFDIVAGKELYSLDSAHTHAVNDIDFHPEEFLMATGSSDKTVKLWDLETKQLVNSTPITSTKIQKILFLDASFAHATGVDASAQEASLLAASKDNMRVWQFEPCRNLDHLDVSWPQLADMKLNKDTKQIYSCAIQKNRASLYTISLDLMSPFGGEQAQQRNLHLKPKVGRLSTPMVGADHNAAGSRPPSGSALRSGITNSPPRTKIENRPPFSTKFVPPSSSSSQKSPPRSSSNQKKPFLSQVEANRLSRANSSGHIHSVGSLRSNRDNDVVMIADLETTGHPVGLDIASFLPNQNHGANSSASAKDMSAKELLRELRTEHDDMCRLMSSRLDNYKVIRRLWNKGDRIEAIQSLNNLQDSATTTDVLHHLMKQHNTRYLTLDMCKYLLPLICGLLLSKVSHYHDTALNACHTLYKSFGQLIRQSLSAPLNSHIVDLSKEARIDKCKHCREYFVQVRKIIKEKHVDEKTDEMGELARNVC